jgi:hypothetical protein
LASSGLVVAADVGGLALDGEEFGDDLDSLAVSSAMGLKVLRVRRRRSGRRAPGPSRGEVEVAAAVVDGAEFAAGAAVVFEELAVGGVEGVGEDFGLRRRLKVSARCSKRRGEGEELAEAVPAEVVLLDELLDVLRRGAAGAGLEEAAAVHEGTMESILALVPTSRMGKRSVR